MFHSTATVRRTASALGASALLAILLAGPAAALPDPGTGGRDFPPPTEPGPPVPPLADDDAVEYLQVGAGILAGIALAGAGAAVVARRNHREPSPA